jgi:hypothetical protein
MQLASPAFAKSSAPLASHRKRSVTTSATLPPSGCAICRVVIDRCEVPLPDAACHREFLDTWIHDFGD